MSEIYSFLKYLRYRQTSSDDVEYVQLQLPLGIHAISIFIAFGWCIFWPFSTLFCGLIQTLVATGLDQHTDALCKSGRQVNLFLNFLQSRIDNRLWLCFRKYTTIITVCVDWVGQIYTGLFRKHAKFPN